MDSRDDSLLIPPPQTPRKHPQSSPRPAPASTSSGSSGSKPPAAPQGLGSGLPLPARKPKPSAQTRAPQKPAVAAAGTSSGATTRLSQAPQQAPSASEVPSAATAPPQASTPLQQQSSGTPDAAKQAPDSGIEEIARQAEQPGMPQGMGGLGQLLGQVSRAAAPSRGQAGNQGNAGGLMGMLNQMMQSPALQQMAEQLADGHMGSEGGSAQASGPDLGSIMQQMMPMVSQMFGSSMANGTGSSATSGAARRSLAGGAESPSHTSSDAGPAGLDALSCLPAERAEQWRQRIMADRDCQAEMQRSPLSEAYRKGKPGHMPSEPLD